MSPQPSQKPISVSTRVEQPSLPKPLQSFLKHRASIILDSQPPPPPANPSTSFSSDLTFQTKYGLSVTVSCVPTRPDGGDGTRTYTLSRLHHPSPETTTSTLQKHDKIFPDFQTSSIWRNSSYPLSEGEDDSYPIDNFAELYPAIADYFSDWRDVYEDGFEAQGLHLGGSNINEIFPSEEENAAC
ncbi:hypothetical protein B0H63DRAFT_509495 [Podospora didyma]|uniref:Uncharacterized protein n=1 Tax=Podospora didyma TaxID=330526 RepID=A0AAE0U1U4_9PEZI|nr:hypothetical protein B0H63DRAFT_509495 [Podospora didyma]